jgi:hypothetical protein
VFKHIAIAATLLGFAFVAMGQDGCGTESDSDDRAQERREAQQDRAERRAERLRELRRDMRRQQAKLKRQREQRAARAAEPPVDEPSSGGGSTAVGAGCEPGYDPCVPTYPPDIDCADLGTGWRESNDGGVTVTGDDPHLLDLDGDGKGCEL